MQISSTVLIQKLRLTVLWVTFLGRVKTAVKSCFAVMGVGRKKSIHLGICHFFFFKPKSCQTMFSLIWSLSSSQTSRILKYAKAFPLVEFTRAHSLRVARIL